MGSFQIIPDEIFYTVGVFGAIVCVTGIICNVLSLLVFARRKSENAVPVFFMALAGFDLVYVLICLVFESSVVIYLRAGGVMHYDFVDHVFQGINRMSATGSIFTTTALTIDRSIAVEKPFRWSVLCTRSRALVTVLFILIAAVVLNLPYIFAEFILEQADWRRYRFVMDVSENFTGRQNEVKVKYPENDTCGGSEKEPNANFTSSQLTITSSTLCVNQDDNLPFGSLLYQTLYMWMLLPVCQLGIPGIIIIVATVRLVRKLRSNKVGIDPVTTTSATKTTTSATKPTPTVNEKPAKPVKAFSRVAAHVIIMAAITVLANAMLTTSYFVMSLSDTVYVNHCSTSCMIYIGVSHIIVALSSSVKLILICVFNKAFREEIKSLFDWQCFSRAKRRRPKSIISTTKSSKRLSVKRKN